MGNQINFYSFEQFCIGINHRELLVLWNKDLNDKKPSEVGYMSVKQIWFNCQRGLHEPRQIWLNGLSKAYKSGKEYCICNKCNSIGQYIVDTYDEEYLNKIWSDKNDKSPFDISRRSVGRIWLKCQNDDSHPDYDLTALNFKNSHNCPYCVGKRTCLTNSLGFLHPKIIPLWSDKNKLSPFDYTSGSNEKVFFKCEKGIHNDYKRMIYNQVSIENSQYICPVCSFNNRVENIPRGKNSQNWKGDAVSENRRARDNCEYDIWRKSVFEKDDYTCQCCGQRGGKLNAHHLKDFAHHENLRYDISNGITLCASCHDSNIKGSFHNLYGTHKKTEKELEQYVNNKRKQLGINIPFSIESYKDGNILKPGDVENASLGTWVFDKYSPSELRNNITKNCFIKMKLRYRI